MWVFTVVGSVAFSFAALMLSLTRTAEAEGAQTNEEAAMRYVGPLTYHARQPVRLYVLGNCGGSGMEFPRVKTQPPSKGKTGIAALREIFQLDKSVRVTEDNGIIRIWIGKAPIDLLRTKLTHVLFDREVQYDPSRALGSIIGTKEVQAAMQSLRLTVPWSLGGTAVVPDKSLLHLSGSITAGTVEQAVDTVVKTWGGQIIVVYIICAHPGESGETLFELSVYGQFGSSQF